MFFFLDSSVSLPIKNKDLYNAGTDRGEERWADRQTPHDGIGRAMYSVARQKLVGNSKLFNRA